MQQTPAYGLRVRILIMGSSNIGKTAMTKGYLTNQYSDGLENSTIGLDLKRKKIMMNEKVIFLETWDTSGLERFQDVTFSFFKGMESFILVYSIIKRETFVDLQRFLNALEERGHKETPKILVGTGLEWDEYDPNKEDKEFGRMVSYDEAEEFAEKNGMLYFEVSTTNGKNIQQPFENLIGRLVRDWESREKEDHLRGVFKLRNQGNVENRHGQSKCVSCGP